jgi:hypothetical protein
MHDIACEHSAVLVLFLGLRIVEQKLALARKRGWVCALSFACEEKSTQRHRELGQVVRA